MPEGHRRARIFNPRQQTSAYRLSKQLAEKNRVGHSFFSLGRDKRYPTRSDATPDRRRDRAVGTSPAHGCTRTRNTAVTIEAPLSWETRLVSQVTTRGSA